MAAVALLAGAVLTTTLTSASETDTVTTTTSISSEGQQWFGSRDKGMRAWFEQVRAAIEANDFTAFQTATADSPLAEKITTQAQFEQFVQMHTLMEEGKTEEAKAIATELGLSEMKARGMHGDSAKMEAIKAAIDANDYTAFQTALADDTNSPLANIDTAEKFAKLVKMHSLLDEAKTIGEELWLKGHQGDGEWRGRKWGKGFGGMMGR